MLAQRVDSGRDPEEVLDELEHELLVGRFVRDELQRQFEHVLAEHRHPGGAVRLFEAPPVGSARCDRTRRCCPGPGTPLKDVVPSWILAIHPPGEIHEQSLEALRKEGNVELADVCSSLCRNSVANAWTGGLTSPKFHSYAGIWPLGCRYSCESIRSI